MVVVVWCGTGVVEKTARDLIVEIATALPALHLLDTSPLLRQRKAKLDNVKLRSSEVE